MDIDFKLIGVLSIGVAILSMFVLVLFFPNPEDFLNRYFRSLALVLAVGGGFLLLQGSWPLVNSKSSSNATTLSSSQKCIDGKLYFLNDKGAFEKYAPEVGCK
ncbi:MAG: hypothetical protein K0U21_08630 [Proteobacteria bacterium]|nr:hypothetical protein [Pseudomonadota bacterium]